MKKVKLLFYLLSILFIYSSCSSDDSEDNPTINVDNIVGNWKVVDYHANLEATTTFQGQSSSSTAIHQGNTYNAFTEFTENPNETIGTGSFINHITTTSQGQTIEQDFTVPFNGNGTWEINDNILTISGNGQEQSSVILELTETTLKTRTDIDTEITVGENTQTNVGEVFYTYEKQ